MTSTTNITQLLVRWRNGDQTALDEAEDSRLERKVALKVLPAAFTQNPDRATPRLAQAAASFGLSSMALLLSRRKLMANWLKRLEFF